MTGTVLVTGAAGFIGRVLCETLARSGYRVRAALRSDRSLPAFIQKELVGEIGSSTDWSAALDGVDYVIHAAARVHVMRDTVADLSFETNANGTRRLAAAAAAAGVKRFVFLSSIKVNGEETTDRAYSATDAPQPQDAYGHSKLAGEKYVQEIGASTSMSTAIVRPPLVYGPGVKANFLRLLHWVDRQRPLPFAAIENSRSLVSIWNLCDLLILLMQHPAAAGATWMVSDGEDLSTAELIRRLGQAMGRRVQMFSVPVGLLRFGGALVGRKMEVKRLCGSLAVDISWTRAQLGWSPVLSVNDSLARTVAWYLAEERSRGA